MSDFPPTSRPPMQPPIAPVDPLPKPTPLDDMPGLPNGFGNAEAELCAVELSCLLRRCGRALAGGDGGAADKGSLRLSSRGGCSADAFVSHTWCTSRFQKFAALSLHFNLGAATAATGLASAAVVALTAAGQVPVLSASDAVGDELIPQCGFGCLAVAPLVFLSVLVGWPDTRAALRCSWLPFREAAVFLDAARGLQDVAPALSRSRSLVVLYSPEYARRLWTVYELMSFLALRPEAPIVVFPVSLPRLVGTAVFAGWALALLALVRGTAAELGIFAIQVLCVAALLMTFRAWAQDLAQLPNRLLEFSLRRSPCVDEACRFLVEIGAARTMQSLGLSRDQATGEARCKEAAMFFEERARSEVPDALASAFGRMLVPYKYVAVMYLGPSLHVLDGLGAYFQGNCDGHVPRALLLSVLRGFVNQFAVVPLLVAMISTVARLSLRLRGPTGSAALVSACLLISAFGHCALYVDPLSKRALSSDAAFAAYVCVIVTCFASTYTVYVCLRVRPRCHVSAGRNLADEHHCEEIVAHQCEDCVMEEAIVEHHSKDVVTHPCEEARVWEPWTDDECTIAFQEIAECLPALLAGDEWKSLFTEDDRVVDDVAPRLLSRPCGATSSVKAAIGDEGPTATQFDSMWEPRQQMGTPRTVDEWEEATRSAAFSEASDKTEFPEHRSGSLPRRLVAAAPVPDDPPLVAAGSYSAEHAAGGGDLLRAVATLDAGSQANPRSAEIPRLVLRPVDWQDSEPVQVVHFEPIYDAMELEVMEAEAEADAYTEAGNTANAVFRKAALRPALHKGRSSAHVICGSCATICCQEMV